MAFNELKMLQRLIKTTSRASNLAKLEVFEVTRFNLGYFSKICKQPISCAENDRDIAASCL